MIRRDRPRSSTSEDALASIDDLDRRRIVDSRTRAGRGVITSRTARSDLADPDRSSTSHVDPLADLGHRDRDHARDAVDACGRSTPALVRSPNLAIRRRDLDGRAPRTPIARIVAMTQPRVRPFVPDGRARPIRRDEHVADGAYRWASIVPTPGSATSSCCRSHSSGRSAPMPRRRNPMATFVGIDLGTTNSVVAYRNAYGRPEVIANREGQNITPSVVYFGTDPPGGRAGGEGVGAAGQRGDRQLLQAAHGQPALSAPVPRPRLHADRPLGAGLEAAQGGRRGEAGRGRRPGRHHRAGLLRRRPAQGDDRRRQRRRARGPADHQRADRRGAGLRAAEDRRRARPS